MATDKVEAFLAAWHSAARERKIQLMDPWVAEHVTMSSPALHRPKRGRAEVMALLADVVASISDYRVSRTWIEGSELLLEFDANVGRMALQGIDRISLDPDGRLFHLTVYVRPFRGLLALMAAIAELQIRRLSLPRRIVARVRMALRGRL